MLLVTREMHTKSSVRYHHAHIPILRNSKNEEKKMTTNIEKDLEQVQLSTLLVGQHKSVQTFCKTGTICQS